MTLMDLVKLKMVIIYVALYEIWSKSASQLELHTIHLMECLQGLDSIIPFRS